MKKRITDPRPRANLQEELFQLIGHSKEFSRKLKELLKIHEIDIEGERKATVEALKIVLQKWVVEIIHVLFIEERLRFNDIQRNLTGISSRTLTSKLRMLEDSGFVKRIEVSRRPAVFEYTLTDRGTILAELSCPIILYLKIGTSS